jgi:drug/metabolite transporter (DMT)-like permease
MLDQQPYLTLPALLAMISAVMHAANNILIKKGLAYSDSQTAVIFTVGMNALLLSLGALLFTPIKELWQPAALTFVAIGIFHPGLTRFLTVKGIERIGVALAVPLRSTTPVFSAGFAILLLRETVTIPILWGTILIVIGVAILSYRKGAVRDVRVRYIAFPILSAAIGAFCTVIYKFGMQDNLLPYPLQAAAIITTTSFILISTTGGGG